MTTATKINAMVDSIMAEATGSPKRVAHAKMFLTRWAETCAARGFDYSDPDRLWLAWYAQCHAHRPDGGGFCARNSGCSGAEDERSCSCGMTDSEVYFALWGKDIPKKEAV